MWTFFAQIHAQAKLGEQSLTPIPAVPQISDVDWRSPLPSGTVSL
jgi:hypothetical protein